MRLCDHAVNLFYAMAFSLSIHKNQFLRSHEKKTNNKLLYVTCN